MRWRRIECNSCNTPEEDKRTSLTADMLSFTDCCLQSILLAAGARWSDYQWGHID